MSVINLAALTLAHVIPNPFSNGLGTIETTMNTLFTLRGLGHRGRMLVHQLSLERPPRPAHALPGIELTVIDLADPRIEVTLLASTLEAAQHIQRRIALVLLPHAVDLLEAPSALYAVREQFDAWIPVLPFEVTHPTQAAEEFGFRRGYLPALRTIFWRLTRMVQHEGMVKFMASDFEEFWTGGATLWSFQVSACGATRAELAVQLLEAAAAEPMFWNGRSERWMMQICTSSAAEHELNMDEIITVTEPFSHEPYNLRGIRWANIYDDDLDDRMLIDVLAIGEPLADEVSLPALTAAHTLS